MGGFTFAEVHEAMRKKSPSLTRRASYFTILESCASHPRTLFSPDAVNRLVYRNGRFIQSSKELLSVALKPLDEMVAEIIDCLSFEEPTPEVNVTTAHRISIGTQRIVLDGMVQADFVVQVDAGLKLAPSAQWSARLKLLERAHSRWLSRLTQHNFKRTPERPAERALLDMLPSPGESAQEPLLERSIGMMDEVIETQEVLIQKRHEQLDAVFSHLARLRSTYGEKTKVHMRTLKEDLVRETGVSHEDVARLLNGTYRMYRSPFLAMVTGNGASVDIVADLEGNPHLQDLPLTRQAIETSPALRALLTPTRPQQIISAPALSRKAVRVRLDTYNDADEAHLLLTHWISTAKPASTPRTENELLTMLEESGVTRDTLRRLLFDRSNRFPRLFTLWRPNKRSHFVEVRPGGSVAYSIRLHNASLAHYPSTHSYLKTVVWPSGNTHPWLQNPEQMRVTLAEELRIHTLNELQGNHATRDKAYSELVTFISKSIPNFERFRTKALLVTALTRSKLDRLTIEYLLGIGHSPQEQLMRVDADAYGYFIETDQQCLKAYRRCTKVIARLMRGRSQLHPWLVAPALEPPISFASSASAIPKAGLAPLQWDDSSHLEIDTLYAELAKLFNERPPIVLGNTEATTRFREDVLAKYLRICEVRKSSGNKHQPVLSLEISEGEERKVEVVIYRGYEEYIHQYPKLQRYLAKTSLKIREV